MNDIRPQQAVIVGIDGSLAAIHAAKWAATEAVEQSVPLRMVAVVKTAHPSWSDYERDVERAEVWLQSAQHAVETLGRPVKVETAVLRGQPGAALIAESRDAEMVCVGSAGIDRYARALVGSTATEVAENAHCPVAVIHSRPGQPELDINWIVVAVNDAADRDVVVDLAMREAQRHKLPVLAIAATEELSSHQLDNRLWPWRGWYPDVRIYPVTTGASVAHFLKSCDDLVPLAVISARDAGQLAEIVGPQVHPIFQHAESSVLIVREE